MANPQIPPHVIEQIARMFAEGVQRAILGTIMARLGPIGLLMAGLDEQRLARIASEETDLLLPRALDDTKDSFKLDGPHVARATLFAATARIGSSIAERWIEECGL